MQLLLRLVACSLRVCARGIPSSSISSRGRMFKLAAGRARDAATVHQCSSVLSFSCVTMLPNHFTPTTTQIVHELEGLHSAAADELEALYEARLALEAERVRQLAAARDDAELAGKEQLQRLRAVHAQVWCDLVPFSCAQPRTICQVFCHSNGCTLRTCTGVMCMCCSKRNAGQRDHCSCRCHVCGSHLLYYELHASAMHTLCWWQHKSMSVSATMCRNLMTCTLSTAC